MNKLMILMVPAASVALSLVTHIGTSTAGSIESEINGPWLTFAFRGVGQPPETCQPNRCRRDIGTVPADDPPWTFNAPQAGANIKVTDAPSPGDAFEVFDFGVSIGTTSFGQGTGRSCFGPDTCFENPNFSSGEFRLAGGPHSITIVPTASPFGGGAAWFRVDVPTARELKEMARDGLWDVSQKLFAASTGVKKPGKANNLIVNEAIPRIEESLGGFLPDDPNRLDSALGEDVFEYEEEAVESIMESVEKGKVANEEILADLRAVIGYLLDADDLLAQTAIDDATGDPLTDPEDLEDANDELAEAREEAEDCEVSSDDESECGDAIDRYSRSWSEVN